MKELRFHEDIHATALANAATPSTILDELEPLADPDDFKRGYREAASRGMYILNAVLAWILAAKNPRIAATQTAFALGSSVVDGRPMESVAGKLGCTRAAISKGARNFSKSTGITPVGSLKNNTRNYRAARIASIESANVAATKPIRKTK